MPFLNPITPETLSVALRRHAGFDIPASAIKLERRSWRWVTTLPDDRIAFVVDNAAAAEHLAREGRLLSRLASHVSFNLPRIHDTDSDLGLQVRTIVPGAQLSGGGREREFAALPQGKRLADDLGHALAEIHQAFTIEESHSLGFAAAAPLLPPAGTLAGRMEKNRLTDPKIATTFQHLLERYRTTTPAEADITLIHGDIWGGNLAVDLETGALNGLYDFADAGIADRHLDLMYIHSFGKDFAQRLFAAYTGATGHAISRQRTALYHAIAAFAALADAQDTGDDALLAQRRRWVAGVCDGPVARMALG
jgi:aminoglycoside phosphotransferase